LDLYASTPAVDFGDALVVAHMEEAGNDDLLSYDRNFDRVAGVRRSEPVP
jgi:predicted nucleic acid-binding protein